MQGPLPYADQLVVNSPPSFDGSDLYFNPRRSTYSNSYTYPSVQDTVFQIFCCYT